MGGVNSLPLISQVKSFVQCAAGDQAGALKTQEDFSKQCVVVSQARTMTEAATGNVKAAQETADAFNASAAQFWEGAADSTPVLGHIKGSIHYALGEEEKGRNCMIGASRLVAAVGGGLAFGGPCCAIAGAVTGAASFDLMAYGIAKESIGDDATLGGTAGAFYGAHCTGDSGDWFDAHFALGMDAWTGYRARSGAEKLRRKAESRANTVDVYRVMRESERSQVMRTLRLEFDGTGEKWVSESKRHASGRNCKGPGFLRKKVEKAKTAKAETPGCLAIRVQKILWDKEREGVLHQYGNSERTLHTKNLYNREKLVIRSRDVPPLQKGEKVNIGIKGKNNLQAINGAVVSVKDFDPNALKNMNGVTMWIARYGKGATEPFAGLLVAPTSSSIAPRLVPPRLGKGVEVVYPKP